MVRNTINPWDPDPTARMRDPDPTTRIWDPDPTREPQGRKSFGGASQDHRREPPKRDEPKGGKKPRGKGGAGRGFGGPNSGDEVDDNKGRSSDNQGDNASYLDELIEETTTVKDDCYYLLPYAHPRYGESSGYQSYNILSGYGNFDRFEKNDFQTSLHKSKDGVSYTWEASYEYSKVYRDSSYPPTFINLSQFGHGTLLPRRWRRESETIIWESMTSHNVICEFEELHPVNYYIEGDYIEGDNLNAGHNLTAIYIRGKYLQTFLSLHTNPWAKMAYTTYWFLLGNRVTIDRKTFDIGWSWMGASRYGYKNRYYTFKQGTMSALERAFWGFGIFPCKLQSLNYNTWSGLYVYDPICEIEYTRRKRVTIPDMNEECCGMIRRIYEFLDPESFPAEMPEKITVNANNPENRIKRINTLPEWLMYRFDIDDERWGEFEVKVEINDVNLMTKEQEHAEIKLPNLAESIAEIFGMVMEIAISHQVTQNAVLTCLHEAGLAHSAAFKAGREVSEILDYLGFETEEKYEKLKTAFTPEADNFEELLEPNESKVKITNQKNAKETLQTALNQIKEIFSIVRAQGTLQVNGNDPSKDILADLTRLYDSMKKQDEIREQETNKVQELLKKDFPDIKIETELIDGDNPLRGTL
ncbi:hypothetical protein [Arthrospira platensis]|uniref:Uncharacterized protein n=1 Tax=Limnospira platensis NIES-46 TaxID=1236695 RepID=A0A5M3TEU0_LIMPL|nr:hypothetical protein [Arthrospira platensis]MDF2208308.1 hypothetical protein [Arthrospira platensis NCB002]BAI90241.1 hypothetical protein NIES39_E00050 [Arthrospira platensis NIES-39]MDF2209505.1 hypothetical protein [Arthrospira platensis NCB002]BDT12558.1 hypothetical protein N39L_22810 [Arthrospira platensis NIES-39]BDT16023.1 hypothetical protein N39L_57460 [Arthrospira platensis NIES-39]